MFTFVTGPVICEALHRRHLLTHMVQKEEISSRVWASINWWALEKATKLYPPLFQLWVAKHASGFCGIGRMMKI